MDFSANLAKDSKEQLKFKHMSSSVGLGQFCFSVQSRVELCWSPLVLVLA